MPESTKGVMSAVEFETAANDFRKAAPGNKAHFGLMALLTHDAAMRKELETAQKARDALRKENERLRVAVWAQIEGCRCDCDACNDLAVYWSDTDPDKQAKRERVKQLTERGLRGPDTENE